MANVHRIGMASGVKHITDNLQSIYGKSNGDDFQMLEKSLETEAFFRFQKGEISFIELNEILLTGTLDTSINKGRIPVAENQNSRMGMFFFSGFEWLPSFEKGKKGVLGEVRIWANGKKMVKHVEGWVHVDESEKENHTFWRSGKVSKADEGQVAHAKKVLESEKEEEKEDEEKQ